MRKLLYITLLLAILGCKDQLYEDVTSYVVIDTNQEKINLLNGIYAHLVKIYDNNYFLLMGRSDDLNVYGPYKFQKDENFSFSDVAEGYSVSCESTTGVSLNADIIKDVYINLYAAIINANELICVLSLPQDDALLGEAYFLRAYCYFKLARFFGTPPLVVDTDVNYLLKKPSYLEVYQLIEEDLLDAIHLLPDTYSSARLPLETPHRGTAKAMLAEVYLAMAGYPVNDESKYAEAAKLSGEVIGNAAYYGFELISDLKNLKVSAKGNCKEHIFSLRVKSADGYYFRGLRNCQIEFKYFKMYPDNYRKNVFIKCGNYYTLSYETPDSIYDVLAFRKEDPLNNPCSYISNVSYLKWSSIDGFGNDKEIVNNDGSEVTLYLLRYAQTLLTYAETKARSGQMDESCYEAVNKIRRRAYKLDINSPSAFDLARGLSAEQFIDSVVQERSWELCSEPNGRWFDIIRLNLRDNMDKYRYPFDIPSGISVKLLTDDWYFYQIPQEDRWVNPNYE